MSKGSNGLLVTSGAAVDKHRTSDDDLKLICSGLLLPCETTVEEMREEVKETHPDACVQYGPHSELFFCRREGPDSLPIGHGNTEAKAWAKALRRLRGDPDPDGV
jgi:hypothetical protein